MVKKDPTLIDLIIIFAFVGLGVWLAAHGL